MGLTWIKGGIMSAVIYIPADVIALAIIAESELNDDCARRVAKEKLKAIRDYINRILVETS